MNLVKIFVLLFIFTSPAFSEVVDKVVANVDGLPVTYREVLEEFKKINPEAKALEVLSSEDIKLGLTGFLIQKEAAKLGLEVQDDEIESQIASVVSQNNMTRQDFIQALKQKGVSLDEYKSKLKNEITRNRVISSVLKQRVQVNKEELESYMDSEKSESEEDGSFGLFKIETLVKDIDYSAEAEKLSNFLKGGGSCDKYTSQYFKSCENLGTFRLEDLKSEYADALKNANMYVFSELIIENGLNYVLFKVESDISKSLSKVGQGLKDKLLQEKFKTEVEKYLSKEIFDLHNVEFHF